jgi:hypothetical protein
MINGQNKDDTPIRRKIKAQKNRKRTIRVIMTALAIVTTVIIVISGGKLLSHRAGPDKDISSEVTSGVSYTIPDTSEDQIIETEKFVSEYIGTSGNDILSGLQLMAENDSRIADIINDIGEYPEELLLLLLRNHETTDFVLHYPVNKDNDNDVELTNSETGGGIPLFLQWDERWGYKSYGSSIIAISGCGPVCLSMVIVGITGNTRADPAEVSRYSEANGYCTQNNDTDWGLLTSGAASYGLTAKELPLWESSIVQELQNGDPVICCMGPGDFTDSGHFIVLYGYEDGYFLIHDPNSIERSNKKWDYDSLADQIRNLWSYSAADGKLN